MKSEERAKELGVKIIPARPPMKRKHIIPLGDVAKEQYMKSVPIVAICGGCGCEIKQNERKEPCGREDCPFGTLSINSLNDSL